MLFNFRLLNEDEIEIKDITTKERRVHIPAAVHVSNIKQLYIVSINKDTLRYLSGQYNDLNSKLYNKPLYDSIDFDESSVIELIYSIFITRFKHFNLPPHLKRIVFDSAIDQSLITLHQESPNKYIILEKREQSQLLRNNHPHELNMYKSRRKTAFIRETTRKIGDYSFSNDMIIESVKIPSSVEVIGQRCFDNCTNLKSVVIPKKSRISNIGTFAFHHTAIRSIAIPASVEIIRYWAFYECKNLERVIFPKNSKLKKIQSGAFEQCIKLRSITFPESLEIIENTAFLRCNRLKRVLFNPKNKFIYVHTQAFRETLIKMSFPHYYQIS